MNPAPTTPLAAVVEALREACISGAKEMSVTGIVLRYADDYAKEHAPALLAKLAETNDEVYQRGYVDGWKHGAVDEQRGELSQPVPKCDDYERGYMEGRKAQAHSDDKPAPNGWKWELVRLPQLCANCGRESSAHDDNDPDRECEKYTPTVADGLLRAVQKARGGLAPRMPGEMPRPIPAAPGPAGAEALTDTYVQKVPDHCDRITWRNNYYHLPLPANTK